MERPLFSDMLYERRRQLGLSIKQASNVLRLKEEVLVAFEEGDFESIPKSGYAQGMLSSYARYLGLNAKTVVNQFSQDLFEHERGSQSHEARRNRRRNRGSSDEPLYETPQANMGQGGSRRTYVESRGFLPTSGGFAGDMGDFATTSPARPRYRQTASSDEDRGSYGSERPYTSRVPNSVSVTPLGQAQRQRPSSRSEYGQSAYEGGLYGDGSYRSLGAYSAQDDITTRRVSPSQYRDDMRLDTEIRSYESASSSDGRRSSRNIASTTRPNVQRRSGAGARDRNRRSSSTNEGLVGVIRNFFDDRGRTMAVIIGVMTIILTCIVIFSARSCINAQQSSERSVTVTQADKNEEEKDKSTTEEEDRARAEAAAAKAAETESTVTERTIEVNVEDGEVTWLEVEYDGKSDVAETVTGPWNRTYTVRQSISIKVNNTSAVTVTENGKKLEFDSKASGIGSIAIQVAKKSDAATETTTEEEHTEDPAQQQSTEDTSSQEAAPAEGQQDTQAYTEEYSDTTGYDSSGNGDVASRLESQGYTAAEDGNYYGMDGYYDAAGNYYPYE